MWGKIFVDASYDWQKTVDGRGSGWIAIADEKGNYDLISLKMSFPGLRQLINRFELEAIKRGLRKKRDSIVYSDSSVAVRWAKEKRVRWAKRVCWIPRDKNVAGWLLENIEYES